jgi:hypothetical protein
MMKSRSKKQFEVERIIVSTANSGKTHTAFRGEPHCFLAVCRLFFSFQTQFVRWRLRMLASVTFSIGGKLHQWSAGTM